MCGKCEPLMMKVSHGAVMLGMLSMLLTVATKLSRCMVLGMGPRSFAAGAALLLLLSIAIHSCLGPHQHDEKK